MRGEHRDSHPGLPDLPGLSRRIPALPAVRVGDNSPWARSEDPHQLQSAFWSGGPRLQVRVHSPLPHSLSPLLPPSFALSPQSCPDTVWNSAPYWSRSSTSALRDPEDMRLLAVASEEMGFDGFCNSYLIRREGVSCLCSGFLAGV